MKPRYEVKVIRGHRRTTGLLCYVSIIYWKRERKSLAIIATLVVQNLQAASPIQLYVTVPPTYVLTYPPPTYLLPTSYLPNKILHPYPYPRELIFLRASVLLIKKGEHFTRLLS